MQGLGNDFVVIDGSDLDVDRFDTSAARAELARALCDRRLGIGADGLILMLDHTKVSIREILNYEGCDDCNISWIYVNGDGSPSEMCGNGLRCAALWARLNNKTTAESFVIATQMGKKEIVFKNADEITISLGEPILQPDKIPVVSAETNSFVRQPIGLENLSATCVSMGNPHVVLFDIAPTAQGVEIGAGGVKFPKNYFEVAPTIQQLKIFPNGVNVEFAIVESRSRMRLFVYERGCGATLACGTGAAAALVAGVLEKRIDRRATIQLPGGCVTVEWNENDKQIRLTGPAAVSFSGIFDLSTLSNEHTSRTASRAGAACQ